MPGGAASVLGGEGVVACGAMGGGASSKKKGDEGKSSAKAMLARELAEDEQDSDDEEYELEKKALEAMEANQGLSEAMKQMGAGDLVFETFTQELRYGYTLRREEREQWVEQLDKESKERAEKERELEKLKQREVSESIRKHGQAIFHKRIAGWPAGGMHQYGY
eukprot:TRINITY_DN19299_c0_g1_i1.p1 TRINITY_DN19299_c0_g1~~TRINITY_DN19299_c0_g1_i1.p1  ORF type:complete len:164 (+),score=47.27 TRINITY_DN19299_c0_g1_i1:22-513(+)